MNYALMSFQTDFTMRPDELAPLVEERGFESLWFPDHSHIPASRRTPHPQGIELPRDYWHLLDPLACVNAAAAVTKRLRLGTGVLLVCERDPITTAKEVATADFLSKGRLLFGVGGGWNLEEMENHGTDPKTRWRLVRERVEAMKQIWTQETAEYHGSMVRFDPIWAEPKPAQKPHPPILLGGHGPKARQRVVDYCDGWMPIPGLHGEDIAAGTADLRERAKAAGRDPRSISVTVFWAPTDRRAIDGWEHAGVERVIFGLPAADRDSMIARLDELARFAEGKGS
jgi:probable F420-dependent oxidoreductase